MSLRETLMRHEGKHVNQAGLHTAYKDSRSYLTIGYGCLIDERLGGGITEEEARYLLDNRIRSTYLSLSQFTWFNRLSTTRQEAVANLAFNVGVSGLLGFKRMIAALEINDYTAAAREALDSEWAGQVGQRATDIALSLEMGKLIKWV